MNSLWTAHGREVDPAWLDPTRVRVLYRFDGPKAFVCRSRAGDPFLAYWCDEDADAVRYLVVPFEPVAESRLTGGGCDLWEVLTYPDAWLVDLANDGTPVRCWAVDPHTLPADTLPKPGVMLWPDQKPVTRREVPQPVVSSSGT